MCRVLAYGPMKPRKSASPSSYDPHHGQPLGPTLALPWALARSPAPTPAEASAQPETTITGATEGGGAPWLEGSSENGSSCGRSGGGCREGSTGEAPGGEQVDPQS